MEEFAEGTGSDDQLLDRLGLELVRDVEVGASAGDFLKQIVPTAGAGNEGALCAVAFFQSPPYEFTPLATNATSSVARLTVEPLPGSESVTLRYMEGLKGGGSQPVKNLVSRIANEASETLVPRTSTLTLPICPQAGDTHCLGLQVSGPDGGVPGIYTATATAQEDSGDPVTYTFTAKRGEEAPVVVGPQAEPSASFDLGVGTWTISVDVDDDPKCPDAAGDTRCSTEVPVVPPGGLIIPGDVNGDGGLDISDAVATLGFLFLGSPVHLPCGDGNATDPANLKLVDWQPDGAIDISDSVAMLSFLFLGGNAHALAPEVDQNHCVRIVGCSDLCGQ